MNQRKERKLRWEKPEISRVDDGLSPLGDIFEAAPTDPLRDLIAEIGVPTFDASTPREETFMFLQTAAEIEHALMVEYLYALYSLKLEAGNFALQESIRTIAVQEMGHLMTIQNLLLMLGESPYLSRQDLSPQIEKDPMPFRMEPFTKKSLAKYVAAESPLLAKTDPDFAELDEIFKEAKLASMSEIHRVGMIYAKLYWLFKKTDGPEGPWTNFPSESFTPGEHLSDADFHLGDDLFNRQASVNEWGASVENFFVDTTETREKALEAIWRIAAQGEGLENMEGSHFSQFRNAYRNFDTLPQPPHINVPTNPTVEDQPLADPELERNRISNKRTQKWARLFNQRYHILLLCLSHTFKYIKSDAAEKATRGVLRRWAMQEMIQGISIIGQEMTTQPRAESNGETDAFAAAPFTLTQANIDFPEKLLELWELHKTLNEESLQLLEEMQGLSDLTPSEDFCLKSLKTLSGLRTDIIKTQITANGG
jgi:Ferritin-like